MWRDSVDFRRCRINLSEAVRHARSHWRYCKDGFEPPQLCCIGFVVALLRRCGFVIPVHGPDIANYRKCVSRVVGGNYAIFDIVLVEHETELHCGLMLNPLEFVHLTRDGIMVDKITDEQDNLVGVYRLHDHVAILPEPV